jgi:hypothetical protein
MKSLIVLISFLLVTGLGLRAEAAHQCTVSLLQRELGADGYRIYPFQGLIKLNHVGGETTVHVRIEGIPKNPSARNTYKLVEVSDAKDSHFSVVVSDNYFDDSKLNPGVVTVGVAQHGSFMAISVQRGEFSVSSYVKDLRKGEDAIAVVFCSPSQPSRE